MFHSSPKWVARFSSFHSFPKLKYPSTFAQKFHDYHPFLWQSWWAANAESLANLTRFPSALRRAFFAHQTTAGLRRAPELLTRGKNLSIYGENTAKNEKGVLDVLRICQECESLEVVELGESCCVRLVVRKKGVSAWMGVAVSVATKADAKGHYRFGTGKRSSGILNIFAFISADSVQSFRYWTIPGNELHGHRISVAPKGKWKKHEVMREHLGFAILQEAQRSQRFLLSEWRIPLSSLHAKEERIFAEANCRVYQPLGLVVAIPKVKRGPTDVIVGGIQVQNKTAVPVKGLRGLKISICKYNGILDDGKYARQPYHIDDSIDAIVAYCLNGEKLCGLFVFPKSVIAQRGWFQGDGRPGKTTAYLYPPYVIPGKGTEFRHRWQLGHYLDLDAEPNLERARALLNTCIKGKPDKSISMNVL